MAPTGNSKGVSVEVKGPTRTGQAQKYTFYNIVKHAAKGSQLKYVVQW